MSRHGGESGRSITPNRSLRANHPTVRWADALGEQRWDGRGALGVCDTTPECQFPACKSKTRQRVRYALADRLGMETGDFWTLRLCRKVEYAILYCDRRWFGGTGSGKQMVRAVGLHVAENTHTAKAGLKAESWKLEASYTAWRPANDERVPAPIPRRGANSSW